MNAVEDRTLVHIYIRKQSNHHSVEDHEDKLKLKTNQMRSLCKNNAMSEILQTEKVGGGVTHRIGSIRLRHGAQLSWRFEVKFHVNVFTLRVYVFVY